MKIESFDLLECARNKFLSTQNIVCCHSQKHFYDIPAKYLKIYKYGYFDRQSETVLLPNVEMSKFMEKVATQKINLKS